MSQYLELIWYLVTGPLLSKYQKQTILNILHFDGECVVRKQQNIRTSSSQDSFGYKWV